MKRFKNFLKSKEFNIICSIFIILSISVIVKLSLQNSFEHMNNNLVFKLRFDTTDPDLNLDDFTFKCKNKDGDFIDGNKEGNFISFSSIKLSDLSDTIELKITSDVHDNISLSIDGKSVNKNNDVFSIDKSTINRTTGESNSDITLSVE